MKKRMKSMIVVTIIMLNMVLCFEQDILASQSNDFKSYYQKVLVPKYGVFNRNQSGTLSHANINKKWLKPKGIISARVMDYDLDGKDEMLVVCLEPINNSKSKIMLKMYEKRDGNIKLSSEIRFNPYYVSEPDDAGGDIDITVSDNSTDHFRLSTVKKNKSVYLVCENHRGWWYFADGSQTDYWLLRYSNNKFSYVRSYTQTAGGSCGFENTCYTFGNNGKLKSSVLLYSDGDSDRVPLYYDEVKAIQVFFKPCGIKLRKPSVKKYDGGSYKYYGSEKSILTSESNVVRIFDYKTISKENASGNLKIKISVKADNKF